jgi:2-polyprenyl-6-methoxyphenol hydroxylase-like FAD-dependent oxidoreductase
MPEAGWLEDDATDVLIVGAGPTGLILASQLHAFGVRFRLVDRAFNRANESRALAVQARSLEILQNLGLGEQLVRRGNASARLVLHFEGGALAEARLGDFGATDTRFPFILFVSQAETEAVLGDQLAAAGVVIERGVELVDLNQDGEGVSCVLRHAGGREQRVHARFLAGCDGAHSTVRKQAGIPFEGDAYLQDFLLGDIEVDGPLEPGTLHSFPGGRGVALFFPLGSSSTWRVIALSGKTHDSPHRTNDGTEPAAASPRGESGKPEDSMTAELSLGELQAVVDGATGGELHLRDPAWLSHFRLHHRQAARYRAGSVFLAGDAAHIHSPVGGQGMNTGIQDAWNLGWKLALVARGVANEMLLESYEAERWPVGRTLLRYTDRAFGIFIRAMSGSAIARWLRRKVVARILPKFLGSPRLRAFAFRFVSELGIHYRRSPAVWEGEPRLRSGPRAGDRLPDARIKRDGRDTYLQQELAGPYVQLLLCGEPERWSLAQLAELETRYAGVVIVTYLARDEVPGVLADSAGEALRRLGINDGHSDAAQYLVRPDGHIGFRCAGTDLIGLTSYLTRWFPSAAAAR